MGHCGPGAARGGLLGLDARLRPAMARERRVCGPRTSLEAEAVEQATKAVTQHPIQIYVELVPVAK
jgi:hypothetical protein